MRINETQPIEHDYDGSVSDVVLYRCLCGADINVNRLQGGVCQNCERTVSAKALNNDLATTMTISGPLGGQLDRRADANDDYDPQSMVGRMFGHYEIINPLGRGGSGFVFQAIDTSLQRYVAVKVLKSGMGSTGVEPQKTNEALVESDILLQEAVAQARVAHPNIVTIYYVGKEAGEPFYAMELVDGISLSERIRQGEVEFSEISSVAEQIAQALKFSYGLDIIHGDIKPSNILLAKNGTAKLSDFGLARRASEKGKLAQGGTPNYLAPELLHGHSPSCQSDIYALGVTLYEMTFGRLPIQLSGSTLSQWQEDHQNQAIVFPQEWPEHLPPSWQGFLQKLLEKNPRHRFESYEQLSASLKKLTPRSKVVGRPLPRMIATLIDWAFVILLMLPVRAAVGAGLVDSHLFWKMALMVMDFVPIVAYTTLVFFWRQSIGRRLMQLRVINRFGVIPRGRKMAMRSILRMIVPWAMALALLFFYVENSWWELVPVTLAGAAALFLVCNVGALLLTRKHKALHDIIFETQVVIDS